ncbi:MAG: hypothetical protein M1608_01575 [Candidatus Omnitrophica bacterium]|nr:hypothetical protein [Candidatus Omnitrophota bacterium]
MKKTPPSMAWVFLDERQDSINGGAMIVSSGSWGDMPASYHNGACGFSFAHGHSEIHKWLDPRTKAPVRYVDWMTVGVFTPTDQRDIRWISQRTSEAP